MRNMKTVAFTMFNFYVFHTICDLEIFLYDQCKLKYCMNLFIE